MDATNLWNKFKETYLIDRTTGFAIDISRMNFDDRFLSSIKPKLESAYKTVSELERGSIANPDEKRMVGHYWLRDASLAPSIEIRNEIESTLKRIKDFAADVHSGKIAPPSGGKFTSLLIIGIGGSALGPQFVTQALGSASDKMRAFFFDNTDPDGMDKVLSSIPNLTETLCVVISKSGGTKETRNGQLIAKEAFKAAGIDFSKHFVAVTGVSSELDKTAVSEGWLVRFPMWDWVGGRTSELSAVGLLPAALQGFDIDAMLAGARAMDQLTKRTETKKNPAALLALSWYHAGCGKGMKDMVILPYKDRLELFSRYLQQLVMESLGKELDLDGNVVNQGIAVYGNKGSTDQHAYVQQLREGVLNFFATFIEVLRDDSPKTVRNTLPKGFRASSVMVEDGITSGNYLNGFFLGTRKALYEKNRESITITIEQVNEHSVGLLIALFERAVSIYALLININAYHQPGVEAGKKAAADVLAIQKKVENYIKSNSGQLSLDQIAEGSGCKGEIETVFKILRHLAANGRVELVSSDSVFEDRYSKI